MRRKYLFIVNPAGGGGRTIRELPRLEASLKKRNINYRVELTRETGHATDIARGHAGAYDVVVSVGGDGTLNEVANGLDQRETTFGIIPVGTGNDLARSCYIPYNDVDAALDILLKHQVRKVDVGLINGRRFISAVGIGFEGRTNEFGRRLRFIKGPPKYIAAIAGTFFTYRRIRMEVVIGDHEFDEKVFVLAIGNGWNVGGGLQLTPKAVLDDGLLDVTYIPRIPRWKILANFHRLFNGTMTDVEGVQTYRTTSIAVRSQKYLPLHIDGELMTDPVKTVSIEMLPGGQPLIGNWDAEKREEVLNASAR